jgi:hypothetical protein
MTNSANAAMSYADLERLLDVYGADRTRWPVEARANAGHLVARDGAARRLLAEAEALDRVLERAPLPSLVSEAALAERIVAAARRTPRMVRILERPASPTASSRGSNIIRWPLAKPGWRPLAGSAFGGAASLLAASLALGVFIGLTSLPQRVVPALQDMTSSVLGNSGGGYTLAQADLEEDLL